MKKEKNEKNENIIIALLVLIIIILLVLVGLLVTGTVTFKNGKIDNITNNNQNISHEETISKATAQANNDDSLITRLVGTYSYKGKYVDNEKDIGENFDFKDTIYDELILNLSGEAKAKAGSVRGGGWTAEGKWYVSNDEIIIINDKCQPYYVFENEDKKCDYPNCSNTWIYKYKIENNTITVKSINNTTESMTLEKIK